MRDHLWNSPDQISAWAAQFLFGQGLISALLQSLVQILSYSDK